MRRPAYLAIAALFVAFLAASAPHLVHHLFEHSHSERPAPCQALAAAEGCQLEVVAATLLAFEETIVPWLAPAADDSPLPAAAPPVSARAPPPA